MGKKPLSKQPIKPISPVAKGQKVTAPLATEKSAAQLTQSAEIFSFHVPVKPPALVEPDSKTLPVIKPNSVLQVEVDKPLTKSGQITAEMYATGNGSPLCQALMMALKHEGKPSYLSDDKYLQRFARYGWDGEDDSQAEKLLRLWQQAPDSDDIVPDDDSAFIWSANSVIVAFQLQYNEIYQAMRKGEIMPSEARFSLEHLRSQLEAITSARNALMETSTTAGRVALLESVYGYGIAELNVDESYSDEQLERLAYANLLMLRYLNHVMSGTQISGIEAFRNAFASSPYSTAPGGRITVVLGEQGTFGAGSTFSGRVPLPGGAGYLGVDPDTIPQIDRDQFSVVYLGREITTAAIIHEFFHQLDRRFGQGISQDTAWQERTSFNEFLRAAQLNMSVIWSLERSILQPDSRANRIAGQQGLAEEIWADLGMTAVIEAANLEGELWAYADRIGNPVGYVDSNNAQLLDCALRQYLRQLLTTGATIPFDPAQCN